MATTPTLGYGQRGEAPIDAVNQWMRSTDWYQALIRSFGQQPNNVHLSDAQKQQVIRAAQANGVVVDEGHNGQEVDASGNFQAKSHALRNTLIVAGVAAAAIATMGAAGVFSAAAAPSAAAAAGGVEAGATAGIGSAVASGSLGLASLPALSTAAATTAISAAASTVGATAAKAAAAKVAASGGAVTVENILKYALPVAGNLVGGLVQANAAGNAQDAQQKYLEEALAYQKEQDTYTRTRQAGLDAQEVQRYGDYQGRIAPFIANGTSSNDRMAALLGLPARAGGTSGGSSGPPASQRVASDPATQAAIRAELQRTNSNDAPAYWDEALASHGDSSTKSWDYWKGRIDTGDGVGKGYAGGSAPAAAAPTPSQTPQPQARSAAPVQMRAPDGSINSVPADQVDHYTKLGATVIGAAA